MVGAKLYERGASIGQVMAFLIASPWNSFSLTLVLIALIGLPWTLTFIGLSMIVAVIVSVSSSLLGIYLSFFIDSAPAPTIVLLMTILFIAAFIYTRMKAKQAVSGL